MPFRGLDDLRHTNASVTGEAHVDTRRAAAQLGHDPEILKRYYDYGELERPRWLHGGPTSSAGTMGHAMA